MCVRAGCLAGPGGGAKGRRPGATTGCSATHDTAVSLSAATGRPKGSLACQTRPPGAASRCLPPSCGTGGPGCRNITGPDWRDPKAQVRPIPPLFPQDRSADRAATEPGHIRHEGGCGEARARGAVLQAPALDRSRRPDGKGCATRILQGCGKGAAIGQLRTGDMLWISRRSGLLEHRCVTAGDLLDRECPVVVAVHLLEHAPRASFVLVR